MAEKTVIMNGVRMPLSAIRPKEVSKEKEVSKVVESVEVDTDHPILRLHARFEALKDEGNVDKINELRPEYESYLNGKKEELLEIADLLCIELDPKKTKKKTDIVAQIMKDWPEEVDL